MKTKRISALLLCLVLCFCSVPMATITTVSAETDSIDLSGVADGGTYTVDGVTYTVLQSADTIQSTVKSNMSGNYILGGDIDFGGTEFTEPIFGTSQFKGVLNGNGYAITDFSMTISSLGKNSSNSTIVDAGLLFSEINGNNAKICNLTIGSLENKITFTVDGTVMTDVGSIAGKNINGTPSYSNITVYADITSTGKIESPRFGGIIGKTSGGTFEKCSFYGSILFASGAAAEQKNVRVGGIVGNHDKQGNLSFIDCHNYASIDTSVRVVAGSTNVRTATGGILGVSDQSSGATVITFRNCSNSGTLVGDQYVGGIVGHVLIPSNTASAYTFENCANSGNVTANIFAGGIMGAGLTQGGATSSTFTVTMTNCTNRADIASVTTEETYLAPKSDDTASAAAGGIVGKALCGDWNLTDCSSIGTISCNAHVEQPATASTATGIIGNIKVNATAENLSEFVRCFAVGTLNIYDETYAPYAIATVNTNSLTKGWFPKVVDCYYALSVNQGSIGGVCNTNLGAGSENYEAVTADDIASGKLAYLLGNQYGQELGVDAAPVFGSASLVAFDGENYVNTDSEHLLELSQFVYVQKSNDETRVRVIFVGAEGEEIPADQTLLLTFHYEVDGETVSRQFSVNSSNFESFVCIDALEEMYYAESETYIYGVVIKNIPSGVLVDGSSMDISYGDYSGTANF